MDVATPTESPELPYQEESRVDWIAALVPGPATATAPPPPEKDAEGDDDESVAATGPEPPPSFHWEWIEGLAVLAGQCPRCEHAMSVVAPRPGGATTRRSRLPDRLRAHPREPEARYRAAEQELRAQATSEAASTRRARGRPRELGKARLRRQLVALAAMEQVPGPTPADLAVVAICNCLEPHPGRPDGTVGCGSYGGLTVAWSARTRA